MPTGWKVVAQRDGEGSSKRFYLVQARDAESAIAVIRDLPTMRGAHVAIADDPPGNDLSWLTFEEGEFLCLNPGKQK